MNKKLLIGGIISLILIFVFWQLFSGKSVQAGKYDEFAKCLADRCVTMYGADWCSHCQNEKLVFGDSFQFVPYIECPKNIQQCLAKGIDGYPTWIFSDGRKLIGAQGLEKLSKESGCPLIIN